MPLPVADPTLYTAQLEAKTQQFLADFASLNTPPPQVFASPPLHYRLRAEFRIWHEGDNFNYVMFDPDAPRTPIAVHDFPIGSQRINQLMPTLREKLLADSRLKSRLYTVEFLTTLSGDALITLVYHRQLDDAWQQAATQLQAQLGVGIIGRSRGKKIVLSRDHVTEILTVNERKLEYRQIEGSFTQPNGHINEHMLTWACARINDVGGALIELYCGNGNFTIALSPYFKRVLATEISKTSIQAAQHNLAANNIDNVAFARLSSDEISTALAGEREFRRLRDIPLQEYRFSTLLVDPPRAGLDDRTLNLAQRFENILYISCNPITLRENLVALNKTHRIAALALFDQFPYTHHLECGVLLQKNV